MRIEFLSSLTLKSADLGTTCLNHVFLICPVLRGLEYQHGLILGAGQSDSPFAVMESPPISTEFEPLGSGSDISDAVTHNRTTMLRSPEAYSPSHWVEADNIVDKQLSTGTLLPIKYKCSRVEDVELKEDIATALRSTTPYQTKDSYINVTQLMRTGTSIAGGCFVTPMTSEAP
ncbi:unnamed protein product [Aureobasidium pullulans]|nr:unnamed protein product [Aureobasidium pullulans]